MMRTRSQGTKVRTLLLNGYVYYSLFRDENSTSVAADYVCYLRDKKIARRISATPPIEQMEEALEYNCC